MTHVLAEALRGVAAADRGRGATQRARLFFDAAYEIDKLRVDLLDAEQGEKARARENESMRAVNQSLVNEVERLIDEKKCREAEFVAAQTALLEKLEAKTEANKDRLKLGEDIVAMLADHASLGDQMWNEDATEAMDRLAIEIVRKLHVLNPVAPKVEDDSIKALATKICEQWLEGNITLGEFTLEAQKLVKVRAASLERAGEVHVYTTDDIDVDEEQHQLRVHQAGNGDWYLSVTPMRDRLPRASVRITTSGGQPGLGPVLARLWALLEPLDADLSTGESPDRVYRLSYEDDGVKIAHDLTPMTFETAAAILDDTGVNTGATNAIRNVHIHGRKGEMFCEVGPVPFGYVVYGGTPASMRSLPMKKSRALELARQLRGGGCRNVHIKTVGEM
jgi:hypothetical protein